MSIKFGFVSTYPPIYCGIATFTASLMNALSELDTSASVIRLMNGSEETEDSIDPPEVVGHINSGDLGSITASAQLLNGMDIAVIQHDFGIYGGADGEEVLDLVKQLSVPIIAVLHTVPARPSPNQKRVLEALCDTASRVIVMSLAARDRLASTYRVDLSLVSIVPHGAPAVLLATQRLSSDLEQKHVARILTWGLLGPGKGIEWAIEAMGLLKDLPFEHEYIIAGRTHPNVLKRDGEQYREGLQQRIDELGLTDSVHLKAGYLSSSELASLVSSCDIVLLPYDSTDQVTSGVLIEAVTARKPVVATAFPHATELLASGAGIIVEHRNPQAMADAITKILENPDVARQMSEQEGSIANDLLWSTVAGKYIELAKTLLKAPTSESFSR